MRFASLGSGSKGNATLVEAGDTLVLVDCGFSVRETEHRLARLECSPEDVTAILVTHEHVDHWRGVEPLARKYRLPVMMTGGTAAAVGPNPDVAVSVFNPHREFGLGAFRVTPVAVPHDAREPVQYVLHYGGRQFGILTDLGCITPHVLSCYGQCDALLLEANHDREMLAQGPYPPALKRRVGGDWGHLSNDQSAQLLAAVDRSRLQCLVLSHISEQNNRPRRVAEAIEEFSGDVGRVMYACQQRGVEWQALV